jgi:hypothetical protein
VASIFLRRSAQPVRATAVERTRPLPGDELITNPLGTLTHAVTIHAAPPDVWSWLVQMGAGRGGWYSYDAFDNGGQPSADRIVSSLQQLEVGMVFPALPGATDGFRLAAFEPERFLILEWKTPKGLRLVTWTFVLKPLDAVSTRLIVRARGSQDYRFFGLPSSLTKRISPIVDVVHFIMQRKQLLGITRRAETLKAVG